MKNQKRVCRLAPVWLGAALLFGGCSPEGMPAESGHGELVPISVGDLWLEGELNTRADGAIPITQDGSAISLYLTNQGGYTPVYNKTYTCTSGQWTTTNDPICVDNRVGQVVAVYDPNNVAGLSSSSTVTTGKLTAQVFDETKLWYLDTGKKTVSNTNPAVAFGVKPAYSRIVLSIQRQTTNYISGDCAITSVNLKSGTAFYADNALDLATETVQGSAAAGGWSYNPNIASIAAGATDTSCDVLIPPQSVTAGLTITLTVDGKDRAVTIPATKFSNLLAAGQQYTIELLMTDAEVSFAGVTKTDMGTTPSNPNIEFTPEID